MGTNVHIDGSRRESAERLGSAVRVRRRELSLSQQDLADLAGVSRRFVVVLEQGKPTVRLNEVLAVLEVLGLDLVVDAGRGRVRVARGG